MTKYLKAILIFLVAFTGGAHAQTNNLHEMVSLSMGMVNISVTENASNLESTEEDGNEASGGESSAASVISADMVYEFLTYNDSSYFIKLVAPLLSSDGSGFFLCGAGYNKYFSSLSSLFTFNDQGSSLTMAPTFRYYIGGTAGIGFVVYNTETAKKSDLLFDLEFHGGAIYNFKKEWGLRAEAGISRGTGVATSAIGIKIFFGFNFYLDK